MRTHSTLYLRCSFIAEQEDCSLAQSINLWTTLWAQNDFLLLSRYKFEPSRTEQANARIIYCTAVIAYNAVVACALAKHAHEYTIQQYSVAGAAASSRW